MEKNYKICIALVVLGLSMIIAAFVIGIYDAINENRCYNLPLNDFYKDKSCLKIK